VHANTMLRCCGWLPGCCYAVAKVYNIKWLLAGNVLFQAKRVHIQVSMTFQILLQGVLLHTKCK